MGSGLTGPNPRANCLVRNLPFTTLALLCFAALDPCLASAQDLTPPVVVKPIADMTVAAGTAQSTINIKKTFGLTGVTGTVVRFTTVLGNMDVELYDAAAPLNVANFLAYVNAGQYNNSFFQRLVSGFIVQGGGYTVQNGNISAVVARGDVKGEHTNPNLRGTLSLALSNGPDTGNDNWFFNLVDNPDLDDTSDGGPFTVFGHIIEDGLTTLDAIGAFNSYDFESSLGGDFQNLPLIGYSGSGPAKIDELVLISSIAPIGLVSADATTPSLLKVTVVGNSNPNLVTATATGKRLTLVYAPGKTGSATITLKAKDSARTKVKTSFAVTVQ